MSPSTGFGQETGVWDCVVGGGFVEALNKGLMRSTALHSQATCAGGPLADPLLTEVLTSYAKAMEQTALGPQDGRGDASLRRSMLRRGRRILEEATAADGRAAGPAEPLSPGQETAVVTLLMECTVLAALSPGHGRLPTHRAADLIQALGRTARRHRGTTAAP